MKGHEYRALFLKALASEDLGEMFSVMDELEAARGDKEVLESFFAADEEGCNILHRVIKKNFEGFTLVASLLDLLRDNEALLKQVLLAQDRKFGTPLDCVVEDKELAAALRAKGATSAAVASTIVGAAVDDDEDATNKEAARLFQMLSAHPLYQAHQTGRVVVTSSLEVQASTAMPETGVGGASNEELAEQLAALLKAQRGYQFARDSMERR